MNFQRAKYREGYFDVLTLIPIVSFISFILLFAVGFMSPSNLGSCELEIFNQNKEAVLIDIMSIFLFSTWGSCVYLFAINADWEDFRAFLMGKGDGELI